MSGPSRGRGWLAHLRAGGTTPWASWAGPVDAGPDRLPGAVNLEVVRRLNLLGRPSPELVDRVLGAGLSGRGRPDLALAGDDVPPAGGAGSAAGAVDPGGLAAGELLRVAALLIAEDLRATPLPGTEEPRRRRWASPYRLAGDPWAALVPRAELLRRGRPEGDRHAPVYVVAAPLDRMLAHAWQLRAFGVGVAPWRSWLAGLARRDLLPAGADPAAAAERWSAEVGHDRVRVVTSPALLPRLLRARGLPATPEPSASATFLARRVSLVLGIHVEDDVRRRLLRERLLPALAGRGGTPLGLPEEWQGWARDVAERQIAALRAGGHLVHGDLYDVSPTGSGTLPDPDEALRLALEHLLEI
jgi:hypothetical protein